MVENIKLIYEIRYPKILNFKDIYKEIINRYFVYPDAAYRISNEGTHRESIRMTFMESKYYLVFTYDRISFQYDGSFEDLNKTGSHIEMCFEIFNKLKNATTFYKTSTEAIEIIALKQIDAEKTKIIEDFHKKYNINHIFKEATDVDISIEGLEKNNIFRVLYGPFRGKKEIEAFLLYSLDEEKKIQLLEKKGIIIQCSVNREADTATKKTFTEIISHGEKVIKKILQEYE